MKCVPPSGNSDFKKYQNTLYENITGIHFFLFRAVTARLLTSTYFHKSDLVGAIAYLHTP